MNETVLIAANLEGKNSLAGTSVFVDVSEKIGEYNDKGYRVVSVTPLTGSSNFWDNSKNESYGYGESFTIGILIIFEKIA